MPYHLLKFPPIYGRSYFGVGRDYTDAEFHDHYDTYHNGNDIRDQQIKEGFYNCDAADTIPNFCKFAIPDETSAGFGAVYTKPSATCKDKSACLRACAMRNSGKKALSKVIRFQFDLPSVMSDNLSVLIASFHDPVSPDRINVVDTGDITEVR